MGKSKMWGNTLFSLEQFRTNHTIDVSEKEIGGEMYVHRHTFYELELILSGDGIYNIDGIAYPIHAGCVFLMSPVSFHKIHFQRTTRLVNIMFCADAAKTEFLTRLFASQPHIAMALNEKDTAYLHLLSDELAQYLENSDLTDVYATAVLDCILGKLCALSPDAVKSGSVSSVQYAILYMQNHFTEPIMLEDAARVAGYTPNYFSGQLKAYTGMTFKQYLADLRYSFAKKLLEHTDLSVSQICLQCGFGDLSHFMAQFRKRYGITPRTYRESK